ncbi:hypothetical protein [Xylocopilactobacillus apis]|uniref:Uncharacterized protein n=1 Tax=Xylocopilactobacillus apis TaxID=2932183 RepID=A0AAU9D001_9LACO|nr:hypothetical protein [Xylocopilactobacillus apis]BDR56863.1 hypothetical protein KIMC2_14250 [Xylocopilactobacillus apis]
MKKKTDTKKYTISEKAFERVLEEYEPNSWTKPGTEEVRYYLQAEDLEDLIGLDQTFHKSGRNASCYFIDEDGEKVKVSNVKGYGEGRTGHKTYISQNQVFSDWLRNDDYHDIPALIAKRIEERYGK